MNSQNLQKHYYTLDTLASLQSRVEAEKNKNFAKSIYPVFNAFNWGFIVASIHCRVSQDSSSSHYTWLIGEYSQEPFN